jgi:hypothetical protein
VLVEDVERFKVLDGRKIECRMFEAGEAKRVVSICQIIIFGRN